MPEGPISRTTRLARRPSRYDWPMRRSYGLTLGRYHSFCVVGKDPVDSRTAHTERCGDGARRLTAGMHPLRQSGFGLAAAERSTDRMTLTYSMRTSRLERLLPLTALAAQESRRPGR